MVGEDWPHQQTRLKSVNIGSEIGSDSIRTTVHTLIGVTSGTLVGLGTVVTLVQALITAGHSDSVIVCQKPSLLRRAWVRLPDLGDHIVPLWDTGVESEIGTREDDRSGPGIDVPSRSTAIAIHGKKLIAVLNRDTVGQGQTFTVSAGADERVGVSFLDGRAVDCLSEDSEEGDSGVGEHC